MKPTYDREDPPRRIGIIDDDTLARMRTIAGDPKLRAEFARNLERWDDAFAAYLIACPYVDASTPGIYKRFQREYLGCVDTWEQAVRLGRVRERQRRREQSGPRGWRRVLKLLVPTGERTPLEVLVVISHEEHPLYVFEMPLSEPV